MRRNLANSEIPIALMGQLQSCLKGSKAALSAETTAKAFTSLTCLHEDHRNGGQNSLYLCLCIGLHLGRSIHTHSVRLAVSLVHSPAPVACVEFGFIDCTCLGVAVETVRKSMTFR
jgi:hypothetical protein